MRTTLELPDPLFKHLKALAAMQGITLRELLITLLEKGLRAPTTTEADVLPSIALGAPLAIGAAELTNAYLAGFLDE